MACPYSHYQSFPFALDPYALQYNRERRERALALYLQQRLGNQPTPNALHAQEYDESPNQTRMMRDAPHTRMLEDEDFDTQFPFDGDRARQQAEIQQANRAIRDQAVREHEASTREWHNFVAFQAHLEEQRLSACSRLDAENFLAETVGPVPVQDEPSLKDMISSHLMEQHRLMAEHRSEVRDALQAILARLSKGTTIKAPTELNTIPRDPQLHKRVKENPRRLLTPTPKKSLLPRQLRPSLLPSSSLPSLISLLLSAAADVFALTYTPVNTPVRAQEHALSLLFADLDKIPSFGSDVVRNARRAVVTRVDQALAELDKGVEERRGRARAEADPVTIPVEQLAHLIGDDPSEPGNVASAGVALTQVSVADEVPI
ncbi:uncharacterized protein BJ212DRAFT_1343445 [Suillus subaureus]|uniref:BAG domain-containing protein n=1 Tax=Suillus subaureus TaxID=48587 RepID=A0A9P7JFP6_9AGAM|nr:uncharacterized protein BJ212DRAFT_1343445 [Suillus subaureus]KAG1819848.1 hypothetical protein BJ212DRAFT_1343445 [Suillus subaureus]